MKQFSKAETKTINDPNLKIYIDTIKGSSGRIEDFTFTASSIETKRNDPEKTKFYEEYFDTGKTIPQKDSSPFVTLEAVTQRYFPDAPSAPG